MAEAHPVGFQWVMEAKKRGAKVIHVDPRFTRTSANADLHIPIRSGSDIALDMSWFFPNQGLVGCTSKSIQLTHLLIRASAFDPSS